MFLLSLNLLIFLTFLLPEKVYAISISREDENFELPGELKALLSSSSVLREFREIALQEDKAYDLETEKETGRLKRSSEIDIQMAYAVAFSVMENLRHENASDSFNDFRTKEMIRLVSKILDCRFDLLIPYIKKCAFTRQTESRTGKVSCSISHNSSAFCTPCQILCETNAILRSPNYPNDYGGPWNCEYLLEAAEGEKFNLVFQEPFVVEKHYDFLMICYDGTPNCEDHIRYSDGYTKPKKLYTKYNKLWVKFFADASNIALPIGKPGRWQIDASTASTALPRYVHCTPEPGCGSCLNVTLTGGTIRSSNYPDDNLDNLNCKIVIEVSPNAKILLNFTDFVVEEEFDFVAVYDRFDRMLRGELTGYDIPVAFNVKSNKVTIKFKTDGDNWSIPNFGFGNSGRWNLDFTVIYPTTENTIQIGAGITSTTKLYTSTDYPSNLGFTCTAECGICMNITPTRGIIQSPNYPADYGNNLNCTIIISTDPLVSRIVLDFTEFIVEQDYDLISVFDADQIKTKNLSGYTLPESVVLKTKKLILQFSSDENNWGIFSKLQGKWKAIFTISFSDITTEPTETGKPNSLSTTSISSSTSSAVLTTTPALSTTSSTTLRSTTSPLTTSTKTTTSISSSTSSAALTTTPALSTTSSTTLTTTTSPLTITSTKTTTTTTLSTTTSTTSTTQAALPICQVFENINGQPIAAYPRLCNNITSAGGVIQSPNYPYDYPSSLNFRYHLIAPQNKKIRLTYNTFVVEANKDSFYVVEATQYLGSPDVTSYVVPPSVTSVSNMVFVYFLSTTGGNPTIPANLAPGRWQLTFTVV